MRQVFLDLALRNPQHLRQLMGRESSTGQEVDDPLARGALGRQHGGMVGEGMMKSQAEEPGLPLNHGHHQEAIPIVRENISTGIAGLFGEIRIA